MDPNGLRRALSVALGVLLALGLGVAAAPVSRAASTAPVTTVVNIRSGGVGRQFTTVVPATGGRDLPMVVFLGGTSTTTPNEILRDRLLPLAAAGAVSLVYPLGINRQWNVGPSCCTAVKTPKYDDQAYVRAVTKAAAAAIHPDVHRIYLIGYSSGGKLAWQLVCARPGPFAALATYGANPETPCRNRGTPLPVFIGFGARDVNEPIAGRRTDKRGIHPPAVVNLDTWLVRDGCLAARARSALLGNEVAVTGWTPCVRKGLTVQYAIWPQNTHTLPQPPTVPLTDSFGLVAWNFVQKFTRS